jgi:hypothetical protein
MVVAKREFFVLVSTPVLHPVFVFSFFHREKKTTQSAPGQRNISGLQSVELYALTSLWMISWGQSIGLMPVDGSVPLLVA